MKEIIERYIEYMIKKHKIIAAMVTGSYVTGEMGPRSDIDMFFIWEKEYESMRGREYFEGIEFEYFISPEWKYYDRLRTDKVSMKIYSTSRVLLDSEKKFEKIQKTAIEKVKEYSCNLSIDSRKDYKFWLETISSDGEDLFDKGDYYNFLFFVGVNLQKMNDLLCMLHNKLPVYEKYGVKEIGEIDESYGYKLKEFLKSDYFEGKKKQLWVEMCGYLHEKLGDYDITSYERYQRL
ncbi:nucleotidyltransferase domain-containing protein [Proteiniborus sp. MB09-C3]|uniref:nucleotidyltransferase domain-containing protein n=1 Tax=Proteiniborus sp. MB09-C3 TaxID=3050072 RepID=UPI002553698C|nr:nucleotidyltransferase domain-containing protein [Proteiniborus sp. MB09-C3]WIV12724.1 nucleotidyltransferase domain-containing protein [Proteiniborus sp. MB09-C3]